MASSSYKEKLESLSAHFSVNENDQYNCAEYPLSGERDSALPDRQNAYITGLRTQQTGTAQHIQFRQVRSVATPDPEPARSRIAE